MATKKNTKNTRNAQNTGTEASEKTAPALVDLARQAIEEWVKRGEVITPPKELAPEMKEKAGVFVSIHENGELRGCIGTFEPSCYNVALEVIHNAILAATEDPRFLPIREQELPFLDVSVDVLTTPQPIKDVSELDPKKYGIIVGCGYRRGLLLPDLEGVDTPEEQINICRMKGQIAPEEPVKISKFEVKRYKH